MTEIPGSPAEQKSAALDDQALQEIIERLAGTASRLNACTTFREIAAAIAPVLLQPGQFVTINMLEFSEDDRVQAMRVIATANRTDAYEPNELSPINAGEFVERMVNLPDNLPGIFIDTRTGDGLTDAVKTWLAQNKIVSMFVLPLRSTRRTFGFIAINGTRGPVQLPTSIAWAFRNLAEHVSATIQRHNLSEETSFTQRISEQQVQAFNELNPGQTYAEMAQIVAKHMLKEGGRFIVITRLDYDADGEISNWTMVASANRERSFTQIITPGIAWSQLPEMVRQNVEAGRPYLIETSKLPVDAMTPEARAYFTNISVILNVPLRVDGQSVALLGVVSREPTTFGREELNAFSNIGDQMSALIQSRRLLEQTRIRENLATKLVIANRRIATADSYKEMALAIKEALPEYITFVGIQLFDRLITPTELPNTVILVAAAWPDGAEEPNIIDVVNPTIGNREEVFGVLLNGNLYILQDVTNFESHMTPQNDAYSLDRGVKSVAVAGLRVSQKLHGLIVFGGSEPLPISPQLERNLRLITDQLSVMMENRSLLKRTEDSLRETRLLYNMNQELLNAEDEAEILTILAKYVPYDYTRITFVEAHYNEFDELEKLITRYHAMPDGVKEVNVALHDELDADELNVLLKHWQQTGINIDIVENVDTAPADLPRRSILVKMNIKCVVVIPIVEAGQRTQQITLVWDKPQHFSDTDHRLFASIQAQVTLVLQNQKLLRGMQVSAARLGVQVRVLRTLNQFAANVNNAQDEQSLLDLTAQTLVSALEVDHVGIALVETGAEIATVVSEYPDQKVIGLQFEATESLMIPLRTTGRPLVVEDVENDTRLSPQSRASLKALGVITTVFLPLLDVQGQLVGSIGLDISRPNRAITQDDIDIAQTIAAQTSSSLQKIRLVQQSQRRTEQLQFVANFGQVSQSTRETETILAGVLETIRQILTADAITVLLDMAGKLRVAAVYEDNDQQITLTSNRFISPQNTLLKSAIQGRETLHFYDLRQTPEIEHPTHKDMRSVIVVPLISRGEVSGVVIASAQKPHQYNETDVAVLQQLVSQMSIAIENASAYNQSQKLAQNKVLANEISTQLQQQMDMDSLLEVTVNELGKALGAKRARIRLGMTTPANGNSS